VTAAYTPSRRKLHRKFGSARNWRELEAIRNVDPSTVVAPELDEYTPPAVRRWAVRLGLALIVAIVIGYLPGEVMRRNPRAIMLQLQLEQLESEAKELAAGNAVLLRDVEALRSEIGAIEARARADLGMVYPDEVVLGVRREGAP
jgi:cell division protein FtsB